jgi:serine protease AprX
MRATTFLLVSALVMLPLGVTGSAPRISAAPHEPQLRLHRANFDARTVQPTAPTSTFAAAASGPYAIIQFHGPVTVADRVALEQTGVILLEYLPDFAYLVQGSADPLAAAARLPQVYARTPFTLADKLAPALLRALARGETEFGPLQIAGWPDDAGRLARDLQAVAMNDPTTLNATQLLQVASLESVRWIEPRGNPRLLNDYARAIMQVDPVWQNRQLFGAGQVIAVADSGLDTGEMNTLSPDFAGRIVATHVLSPTGDLGDNFGHGTHVAGSVAGAGVQSGANPAQHEYAGSFAGVAPEASLVIQAFEVLPDGSITGLNPDYYSLFEQAYVDGARLHTNSWGDLTGPITDTAAAYGGYPYGSQRTDQFLWEHPDMTIFFAAGNSGQDGTPDALGLCTDGDGVVDPDSLLAPGTAKNIITVGATESNRSDSGLGATPWILLSLCFLTSPIVLDPLADNANGMAAFSSRGPADDGRVKPDIVAPGTNIISNKSHYPGATSLWGDHETNPDYVYSGGTSMATPLTAGMGVLVRQWLTTRGLTNPSAAAVKATLLNTTYDLAPGQYGSGLTQEIPFERPNSVAGWGRADLGFIEAPTPYTFWIDDHTAGLVTGQVVEYTHTETQPLNVITSTQPLRVMLVWTDPPASLSAAAQLVNDLDLVVTGPEGAIYYGNNIITGDRTNNVEGVIINNPPIGSYTVRVRGYNVPIASQPYALAVAGPIGIGSATYPIYFPVILR